MDCVIATGILFLVVVCWIIRIRKDCKASPNHEEDQPYFKQFFSVILDNLKRDILPLFILVVAILIAVFIGEWCARQMHPQSEYWHMIEKFLGNHSVIASVIGTFIGLVLVFVFLRPRLYIHEATVYKHPQKNQWHLKIKVTNTGLFELHDISAKLQWYKEIKSLRKTSTIELRNSEIPRLQGYYKGDENRAYGWHSIDPYKGWKDDYTHVRIQVIATHSFSGIRRLYERSFTREEIENHVMFGFPIPPKEEGNCKDSLQNLALIVKQLQKQCKKA